MAEIVEIEIVMDDGSLKKGFAKVQDSGQKAADAIEKSFNRMSGLVAGALTAFVGAFSAKKIVEAGIESEKAWRGFAAALSSTGQLSKDAFDSFEHFAGSLQKVTGVQDEVIAKGAAILLNVGRMTTEALPQATKAALNLSAALQIGPEQAFQLIAKAATGSTAALERYGIRVKDTIPLSEKFAAVLKLIDSNFHGMAEAASKTFEGALARMQNGFSNVVSNIGRVVTSSPAMIALMNKFADSISMISDRIAKLRTGQDPIKPLLLSLFQFADAMIALVIRPLEYGYNAAKIFVDGFLTGLQTILVGLAKMNQGIAYIYNAVGLMSDQNYEAAKTFADSTTEVLDQFAKNTVDSFNTIGSTGLSDSIQEFSDKLNQVVVSSSNASQSITSNMNNAADGTTGAIKKMNADVEALNKAFNHALAQGISQSIQNMVKAFMAGAFSMDKFAKQMLSIVGDMAIQIGTMIIAADLAKLALLGSPGSALATGAALVAIGTVLKSWGGGEQGLPGGADMSGGGGIAATPASAPEPTSDQLVAEKPKTEVTVVVQGNVFDRRETGLYIADILNENFDINGTKLSTGVG